jgi:hypothetical protein
MQPILAESVPHRGRAIVFAAALALFSFTAVAAFAMPGHHPRHRRVHHHRLMHYEGCVQDRYIIVTR